LTTLGSESSIPVSGTNTELETITVTNEVGDTVHREAVFQGGIIDGNNTTTTLLSSGATYTGTFTRCPDGVTVSCKSVGVGGTLYFDFSNDGVNVDTFPVSGFSVTANIHEYHNAKVNGRYFRVRFVSDAGTQTEFRLYTYFGPFAQGNAPLNQGIGLDTDANITRPTNFQGEVRRGLRSGVEGWNKFGYRLNLTASTEQVIWAASANLPTFLTTASTFDIAYDGTAGGSTDGAGTTGATQLTFYYIDANGNPAVSVHVLGTDGSDTTSFSGLGINRITVSANGGLTYNASVITVTATTGGSVQAVVPALGGVTQQMIFFNGVNHQCVAPFLWFKIKTTNKSKVIDIKGYVWNRAINGRFEVYRDSIDTAIDLGSQIHDPIEFKLNPTDVLYFTATASASGAGTPDIYGRFSLNAYTNV